MLIIGERIKMLRESHNLSQAALAKRLGITRSSVNAWELGLNVPSTQYIIELSEIFKVSTDYLLCVAKTQTLDLQVWTRRISPFCMRCEPICVERTGK